MKIGKRYRVPCIRTVNNSFHLRDGTLLPVIGPAHSDREIVGFVPEHWHIDFRFVSESIWQEWAQSSMARSRVHGRVVNVENTAGGVTYHRLKFRRSMPIFPRKIPSWHGTSEAVPWLGRLEAAYANHRLKPDCMVCPHRGLPLKDLPVRNGVVVCPGHGLAWNLKTGGLVRRTDAAAVSTD